MISAGFASTMLVQVSIGSQTEFMPREVYYIDPPPVPRHLYFLCSCHNHINNKNFITGNMGDTKTSGTGKIICRSSLVLMPYFDWFYCIPFKSP